jgi:hypothetical protein
MVAYFHVEIPSYVHDSMIFTSVEVFGRNSGDVRYIRVRRRGARRCGKYTCTRTR